MEMKEIGYRTTVNGIPYYIPTRMMPGIERYINKGIPAGDFLMAVFENNLTEAMGRADEENFANLPAYAVYLRWEAPNGCWGSKEKINAWVERGGLEGGRNEQRT